MEGFARTLRDVEIALKSLSLDSNMVQSEKVGTDQNGETSASHVYLNTQKPLLDTPIKKHKGRDPGRKLPWFEKGGKKKKNVSKKASRGGRKKQGTTNSDISSNERNIQTENISQVPNGFIGQPSAYIYDQQLLLNQDHFADRFHHHLNGNRGYQPYYSNQEPFVVENNFLIPQYDGATTSGNQLQQGGTNHFEAPRQDHGGVAIDLNQFYDFSSES
ncbi:hypothetical protein FRX31_032812 [Thalictrum thalictroides]|uniref:Uncharacterized protein n=1 Tax=Thalictrum thalictroides TaxID=46969 RepID=A0A7J6UYU6_THATH|nr:hypothetical protein FRX31_032812 [Thalictrum thalictroides]